MGEEKVRYTLPVEVSWLPSSASGDLRCASRRQQCHSCGGCETLEITKKTVRCPPLHGCLSPSARSSASAGDDAQRLARSLHKLPRFRFGTSGTLIYLFSLLRFLFFFETPIIIQMNPENEAAVFPDLNRTVSQNCLMYFNQKRKCQRTGCHFLINSKQ